MQKVRCRSIEPQLLIEFPVQVFSLVYHFLFTFRLRYYSLSLTVIYLALEDGTPRMTSSFWSIILSMIAQKRGFILRMIFKQGRRPHFTYYSSLYPILKDYHFLW